MRVLAASLILFLPQLVFGHAAIMVNSAGQFTPREGSPVAEKTGPCGVPRSTNITTLAPGQTVQINWVEQIKHPGYFIISFSQANDASFTPFAGQEMIPEDPNTPAPQVYSSVVTMPTTPCTTCTIQVIQVMQDRVPASDYFSCADVVISTTAPSPTPYPSPLPAASPQPQQQSKTNACQ